MATGIRDKVAILGMGCSKYGERWDIDEPGLMAEAVEECLADAGIEKEPCVAIRWNGGEWLGLCRFTHIVALHAEIFRLREMLKEAQTKTD